MTEQLCYGCKWLTIREAGTAYWCLTIWKRIPENKRFQPCRICKPDAYERLDVSKEEGKEAE